MAAAFVGDGLFDVFMYFRIGNRKAPKTVLQVEISTGTQTKVGQAELPAATHEVLRICAISDTHNRHRCVTVPPCDILIHTGDILMTSRFRSDAGVLKHYQDFGSWLAQQPARHIIVLGGNHDEPLEKMTASQISSDVFSSAPHMHYLCNSSVDIEGYRFVGTPLSRGSSLNNSFQSASFAAATTSYFEEYRDTEDKNREKAGRPTILLTHGTCEAVQALARPYVHFYGHYHDHYGAKLVRARGSHSDAETNNDTFLSVCSSIMDRHYNPSNSPIILDVPCFELEMKYT